MLRLGLYAYLIHPGRLILAGKNPDHLEVLGGQPNFWKIYW